MSCNGTFIPSHCTFRVTKIVINRIWSKILGYQQHHTTLSQPTQSMTLAPDCRFSDRSDAIQIELFCCPIDAIVFITYCTGRRTALIFPSAFIEPAIDCVERPGDCCLIAALDNRLQVWGPALWHQTCRDCVYSMAALCNRWPSETPQACNLKSFSSRQSSSK